MLGRSRANIGWPAVAVALLLGIGARGTRAATITQTVTFGDARGCCGVEPASAPVNLFDPALGTLDSVAFTGTVTATWYVSANSDGIWYDFLAAPYPGEHDSLGNTLLLLPGPGVLQRSPYSASSPVEGGFSGDSRDFEGIGTFLPYLGMTDGEEYPPEVVSSFSDFALTYNYAPDPVPEPSSLALLLTGLACLGLIIRRKNA